MPEPAFAGPHSEGNVAEHAVARVWTVVRPCWSNLDLADLQRLMQFLDDLGRGFVDIVRAAHNVVRASLAEWTGAGEFQS
jgi:hypothetical protein